MRRLRILIYCIPLILIFLVYHFLASLTYHEVADRDSLTFAITSEPIGIDPLTEQDALSEEIEALIFDRLLGRSPTMELEGRLAESWSYDASAIYYFESERYSQEAWEAFRETEEQWKGWGIADARLVRDHIEVDFRERRPESAKAILEVLPQEHLAPITVWDVHTLHSAEPSLRNYLLNAVEGWQVRRVWSPDPKLVQIHAAGDMEDFSRELDLYYSSNSELSATISYVRELKYLYEPRMRIHLRSGVVWHDGHAFSVEDVLHSLDMVRANQQVPKVASALRAVQFVEASGPLTLVVHYRHQMAHDLEVWERLPIVPAHAPSVYNPASPQPIVGTGPYRIRQWRPGYPIVLERTENSFRGVPENQRLVYERVLDSRLLRLLFQTGAVDSYEAKPANYALIAAHPEFTLATGPAIEHVQVVWNLDHFMFVDPRMREALALGTDTRAIRARYPEAWGKPVDRFLHPSIFPDLSPIEPMGYDPVAAGKLLDEAGWSNLRFGLRYRDRTPLSFRLALVGSDEFQRNLARELQQQWRGLGIQLQLHMASHAEVSRIQKGVEDYDALLMVKPLEPYVDWYSRWHSTEVGPGKGNFSRLRNTRVDDILTEIRTTQQPEKTKPLIEALQYHLVELNTCLHLALQRPARIFREGQIEVVDPSRRDKVTADVRAVGANQVSLNYDLAWWVKRSPEPLNHPLETAAAAPRDAKPHASGP